jgi:hypothetical protein
MKLESSLCSEARGEDDCATVTAVMTSGWVKPWSNAAPSTNMQNAQTSVHKRRAVRKGRPCLNPPANKRTESKGMPSPQ